MPFETLLTFMTASALLSIAPGPDIFFVLSQSALYGRKSGILITLGLCTGLIVHTTAVAIGIAVIFQTSETAFTALKVIGALYLLYLAWQSLNAPSGKQLEDDNHKLSLGLLYRRGIFMNVTNPKVSVFFLAFLPQFASPAYGAVAPQIFLLGGIFMIIAFLIFSLIALLSGHIGKKLQRSEKFQRIINKMVGGVFIALGIKLLFTTNTAAS